MDDRREQWLLVVRCAGHNVPVGDAEVILGRSEYCTLVVEHALVSRVHASLRRGGEGVVVTDLGSRNGTFVRGARITEPTEVAVGESFALARVDVYVELTTRMSASVATQPRSAVAPEPVSPLRGHTELTLADRPP